MDFSKYKTDGFYDELFAGDGNPREIALPLIKAFESLPSRLPATKAESTASFLLILFPA